jgi:rare lipoprotein A
MIGAVQLRTDAISERNEARLVRIDALTKHNFNPLEPRDWHGRWTANGTEDTASPAAGDGISAPRLGSCDDASEQSAALQISARTVSGVASWYNLVGHRMANGRIFDPKAMNAAMLKVALGTVVMVHLADDPSRNVNVTITDRGPYKAGRVIDLTPAAFQALTGTLSAGLARVVVTLPGSK